MKGNRVVWAAETTAVRKRFQSPSAAFKPTIENLRLKPLLGLMAAFVCHACAFNYTDDSGDRHIVGLVDISIHPPANSQTFAGTVVDLSTVGFSVGQTAQGGYVTLGYGHEVSVALKDDVLVSGNPLEPLSPSHP